MNASNRCASCSGADVSSMRGAGAMCVVPGCAGGGCWACSLCCRHAQPPALPSQPSLPLCQWGPLLDAGCRTLKGAEEELGACGARSPVLGMDKPEGLPP